MARLLALDVGDARIGVALSDASGFLASPYTTLHVSRDEEQTWSAIQHMIDETGAEGLVVGLPISLDGRIHAQGARVQAFVARLQTHISLPVTMWDERHSTVEAQRLLAERRQDMPGKRHRPPGRASSRSGRRGRKQHGIDALAAAVILQDYLDHTAHEIKDKP